MQIYNIVWDTDSERIDGLPDEASIPEGIDVEDIADYLSDTYGWCVKSFAMDEPDTNNLAQATPHSNTPP